MCDTVVFPLPASICSICNMPVPLSDAKTDEDGKAVHKNCYLIKLGLSEAVSSHAKVSSQSAPRLITVV